MTTAIDPNPPELGPLRQEQAHLRAQLARIRRRLGLQMALEAALDAAAGLVGVGAVLVALDYLFRWEPPTRRALLGASLLGLAAALAARSLPRLRAARLDDLALAMTLDRYRPGVGQQVADVLQLPGQIDAAGSDASPALIRLAVRRAGAALAAADWRGHWNRGRTLGRGLALVGVLAVPAGFALAAPAAARLGWARWALGSAERWPQRTYLAVAGLGDRDRLLAPRDEPFVVDVRADLAEARAEGTGWRLGGRGTPLLIRRRPDPPAIPAAVRLRERGADGTARDAAMNGVGPGLFRLELPPAAAASSFDLRGGDDWLGPIRVDRVDRPALAGTAIRVRDPGASEGAFRPIADPRQHLVFLPDTEVELTLAGTEPLARARVDFHPGSTPELARVDPRTFVVRWTLREATTLEILLTAAGSGLDSKPSFLSLGLLKDREPRVTLRAQGVGGHVTPVATVPLTLAATDDIGLAALRLQVERTVQDGDKAEPVVTRQAIAMPLATDGGRAVLDHQARHDLGLQAAPPPVGARIKLTAEAEDRCARGPQVGRSGVVYLQVVSADELFYEILIRQRAERAKFVAAYDAAQKLKAALAATPTPDDATTASRALHTLARQVELIAGRIADSLAEMKLNQVGSPKSHRLLQEGVIDPILALNSGPVAQFRAALQSLAAGATGAGDLEGARRLHGEVVARMKTILDQMAQWESFVDVVNQVAEVIKMQQNVLKATEQARETRTQEIFDDKP